MARAGEEHVADTLVHSEAEGAVESADDNRRASLGADNTSNGEAVIQIDSPSVMHHQVGSDTGAQGTNCEQDSGPNKIEDGLGSSSSTSSSRPGHRNWWQMARKRSWHIGAAVFFVLCSIVPAIVDWTMGTEIANLTLVVDELAKKDGVITTQDLVKGKLDFHWKMLILVSVFSLVSASINAVNSIRQDESKSRAKPKQD